MQYAELCRLLDIAADQRTSSRAVTRLTLGVVALEGFEASRELLGHPLAKQARGRRRPHELREEPADAGTKGVGVVILLRGATPEMIVAVSSSSVRDPFRRNPKLM